MTQTHQANVDRSPLDLSDWRKRIHQLKLELRSASSEQSLTIPEQTKAYGTELKAKRDRQSGRLAIPKREIASPS